MFFNTAQRSFTTTMKLGTSINHVTVIGAGVMGSGIAQVIAQSGRKVALVDQRDVILNRAKNGISASLNKFSKKKFGDDISAITKSVSESLGNISLSTDPLEASAAADLVIECVVEDREIKRKLLKEVDKVASPSTIFASNTSSLLIRSIADATNRRDRFAGLHFFNPVPIMKLLEIVTPPDLSESAVKTLHEFGKSIGKICVKCKDNPGFIVNRLLIPHMMEAILMVERGDATMEDVDLAMKLGCGYPIGPFELIDLAGLDIMKHVTEGWARDYPKDTSFRTSKFLAQKVNEGHWGRKTGKGFYNYSN